MRRFARQGSAILGICGGYQMLGERLSDPGGVETEAGTVEVGLGLLPIETIFGALHDKVTKQCQVQINPQVRRGLFAHLDERHLQVYQIHVGQTRARDTSEHHTHTVFLQETGQTESWLSTDGWCAGSYLHGLFENDHFRHGIVEALAKRRYHQPLYSEQTHFSRQQEYDRLAEALRQHLDLVQITALRNLGA
ncbi:MAG: hypothetical protein E6J34_14160 [Chloroflexi bacterium]|nr:MAG: hypothetical protein E6J34_14160 [Chloroflexota bacterium]